MERPKRGLSAFDDIERLDQLGEVGKRPRQPVDLVDDDHVDLSRASTSTAPPRPANQMRRAWLTIWPNRPMRIMIGSVTEAEIAALESWAADVGLKGSTEIALVEGFCDRALAAGLPLARAAVFKAHRWGRSPSFPDRALPDRIRRPERGGGRKAVRRERPG